MLLLLLFDWYCDWFVSGVLSVAYILTFVAVKAFTWGFRVNFSSTDTKVGMPGIL